MERIEELFGRLAELNAEELAELEQLIADQAGSIEGDSPEEVSVLVSLADKLDATRAAIGERQVAQEQATQDAAAARARIAGEPETPAAEAEPEGDQEGGDDPEGEEDPEAAAAPEGEPALVAAGGSRIRRMAAQTPRQTASPELLPARTPAVVVASAGLSSIGVQGRIESAEQLAEGMTELLNGMSPTDGPRGRVLCASARWEYPEDRRLKRDDYMHNDRVFARALGRRPFLSLDETALVASGGVCAPVNVDYSVPTWATADRPLRDALPAFQADRGGITYVPPPDIGDYSAQTGYAQATTIWTEATDANPAGATKPVVQVTCGSPTTVYVNAVPTRLGFGNMTARFAPEQTAANTDVAIAMAARTAEIELLQLIASSCIADVTSATLLGATRDLITVIRQVIAAYRNRHRIPDTVKFTAIFPAWARDQLIVDLAREIGHSQNNYFDALRVAEQYIDDLLGDHGVNPVWHLDGQTASQLSSAGGVSQLFSAQSASGAVNTFPSKLVWYIFPEGTFQFLDAGRLDLGVVRDSTLDATNDYETFVESFEGIAFRGFSSGALQMVSTLCANGGTAGTISTSGSCA